MTKIINTIIIILFFFFIFNIKCYSAEFTVSPPFYFVDSNPGKEIKTSFIIKNESNNIMNLQYKIIDIKQDELGKIKQVDNEKIKNSCSEWIKLKTSNIKVKEINIQPNELQEIEVTIKIPTKVDYRTYLTCVKLEPIYNSEISEKGKEEDSIADILVKMNVLIPIGVNVIRKGFQNIRYGRFGEVRELLIERINDNIIFSLEFINNGLYSIDVTGQLKLIDNNRKKELTLPLGGKKGLVFPGTLVYLKTPEIPIKLFQPGNYTALAVIDYTGNKAHYKKDFDISKENILIKEDFSETGIVSNEDLPFIFIEESFIETKIAAKSNRNLSIDIINETNSKININTKIENSSDIESTKFKDFVSILPNTFEMNPFSKKTVRIGVQAPDLLIDGNKYVTLYFTPESINDKFLSEEIKSAFTIPVDIFLENIKSKISEAINIKEIKILVDREENNIEIKPTMVIQYENIGNTHIIPIGKAFLTEIEDINTKEKVGNNDVSFYVNSDSQQKNIISLKSLSDQKEIVLPGEEDAILLAYDKSIKPGKYEVEFYVYNGEKEIFRESEVVDIK